MKVGASVLDVDYLSMKEVIKLIEDSGVDYIHLDIMDGNFVPNISFGAKMVSDVKKRTNLFLDCHLMVSNPSHIVEELVKIKVNQITLHIETEDNKLTMINKIKNHGIQVGIALNPDTDINKIKKFLPLVDTVLQMTVIPGKGGQSFIKETMEKTKYLAEYRKKNDLEYKIQVDGGINKETILLCKRNGVDSVVAGSYLFNATNFIEQVNSLKI